MRVLARRFVAIGMVAGVMSVLAPSMAQAAVPECNSTVAVRTSQGGVASLPSRNGSTNCYLQQRSPVQQNSATYALQDALEFCHLAGISRDGYFGAATTTALRNFQRSRGLTADGVYGAQTRAALSWPTGVLSADPACQRL